MAKLAIVAFCGFVLSHELKKMKFWILIGVLFLVFFIMFGVTLNRLGPPNRLIPEKDLSTVHTAFEVAFFKGLNWVGGVLVLITSVSVLRHWCLNTELSQLPSTLVTFLVGAYLYNLHWGVSVAIGVIASVLIIRGGMDLIHGRPPE